MLNTTSFGRLTHIFFRPIADMNLSYPESRAHLWSKMQKALHYLYQFRDEFDFFYKVDDDTFAVAENLQYGLKDLNPDEPLISGFPFTVSVCSV